MYSGLRLALAFLVATFMAGEAQATGKRIALVIGNSAYAAVSPLANPKNDADLMAKTLQSVGFEVTKITDADQRAMKQAMLDFGRKLHGGVDASLFYYSGHGVQAKGENYLIPVDASIKDEGELDLQAIDVNAFLQVMDNADSKVNIVILDACRNNPFASSMRSASRGLAMVDAPRGTYIAYSTSPGDVAEDGSGKNSPYTAALARAIVKPGLKLEDAFKEARRLVLAATDNKQLPWETTSITGDFFFRQAAAPPAAPQPPASQPPASQPPVSQPPKVGSGSPAGPPASDGLEVNQNRPGMDYKNFVLATPDPRLCQSACQSDGLCRAWTYVAPGNQGAGARCWLKKGVPPARESSCCISGVKSGVPSGPADKSVASASPVAAPPADQLAWQKIATSSDPADFTRFLQSFPQSKLDDAARARLASLTAAAQSAAAAPLPGAASALPQAADANREIGVFVLLGRWPSREVALSNFRATRLRFRDLLGDRRSDIAAESDRSGRVLYRNRIGPFPDAAQAKAFCEHLQAAGGLCFVPVEPRG
jgi:uncharacterized caspase-like protein